MSDAVRVWVRLPCLSNRLVVVERSKNKLFPLLCTSKTEPVWRRPPSFARPGTAVSSKSSARTGRCFIEGLFGVEVIYQTIERGEYGCQIHMRQSLPFVSCGSLLTVSTVLNYTCDIRARFPSKN